MATKALRIFYRKSDGQPVWTHELRGSGIFPTTPEQDLAQIPDKVGQGNIDDYACIEETNVQRAEAALDSDDNRILDGKLIVGAKRITPEAIQPRNLRAEIDELKARLDGMTVGRAL